MCREIITDLASPEVGKLLNEYKKAQDALEDRGVWSLSPFDKKWTECLQKAIMATEDKVKHPVTSTIINSAIDAYTEEKYGDSHIVMNPRVRYKTVLVWSSIVYRYMQERGYLPND